MGTSTEDVGTYSDVWECVAMCEGVWVLWGRVGTCGDVWRCVGMCGDVWGYVGMYEDLWGRVRTCGNV